MGERQAASVRSEATPYAASRINQLRISSSAARQRRKPFKSIVYAPSPIAFELTQLKWLTLDSAFGSKGGSFCVMNLFAQHSRDVF
jgi:hypothetical protein